LVDQVFESIKDINNLYGFTAEKISGDIERMLKS